MISLGDSFLLELEELSSYNDSPNHEQDLVLEITNDHDDLDTRVSTLHKTQRYIDTMQRVVVVEEEEEEESLDDKEEYKLILDCNKLLVDIDDEIVVLHGFIRDKYRLRFPDLESLVTQATDYARVAKRIGKETDLALVDLHDLLLKPSTVLAVKLIADSATAKEEPLFQEEVLHKKTMEACDLVIDLDSARNKIFGFLETKMRLIAPNLSEIVGCDVAAKLMGTAGGLSELVKMPACHIQLLGNKRKSLDGFSIASSSQSLRVGYLEETEIFQSTSSDGRLWLQAIKLLAGKSALAARIDAIKGDPSGSYGKAFAEEIRNKLLLSQGGALTCIARQVKPLPVPSLESSKKRRGGRRLRKRKERYAVTDMRKMANRVAFGVAPEESSLGDGLGQGYGMLGLKKRLRVSPSNLKLHAKKKLKESGTGATTTTTLTSSGFMTTTLSLPSSLTPQLSIGLAAAGTRTTTYFSKSAAFSNLNNKI
ncbi:unnamed protein product [Cochlearia groenlandica]